MRNDYKSLSGPRRFGKEAKGFMVFKESALQALRLEDADAGALFKAACRYYLIEENTVFKDLYLRACYECMRDGMMRGFDSYFETVDRSSKGGKAKAAKARATKADPGAQATTQADAQATTQAPAQAGAQDGAWVTANRN